MKILSCNVRTAYADDGANNWANRRDLCVAVIADQDADIVGFQEVTDEQLRDLSQGLPGYSVLTTLDGAGVGDPVDTTFYRSSRLALKSSGAYWLSETPHVPGSSSWESDCVRLAVWGQFVDRTVNREFRFVNTHLDHISQAAREHQAAMLNEDAAAYDPTFPQVLTGDMNADGDNPAIAAFLAGGWTDTYQAVHGAVEAGNTFHRFEGPQYEGTDGKIDWIFVRGELDIREAAVITDSAGGRFPSDHYFVSAEVAL